MIISLHRMTLPIGIALPLTKMSLESRWTGRKWIEEGNSCPAKQTDTISWWESNKFISMASKAWIMGTLNMAWWVINWHLFVMMHECQAFWNGGTYFWRINWLTIPRPYRWSLFSRMVSVRARLSQKAKIRYSIKTRSNVTWGLVGH